MSRSITIRMLTYNIHKGIGGVDRRYRIERIIDVLNAYEPDIAFLQEVDDGVPRSRKDRQIDVIGEALGFDHRAFQSNVKLKLGSYGNGILSKFALSDIHDLDLSVRFKKRRRALLAMCAVPTPKPTKVLLLNCHLGLAAFERTSQVNKLLRHIAETGPGCPRTHIVGGDFNDSGNRLGKGLMVPAGYRESHSHAATFPAVYPLRRLDHLYFRGSALEVHSFVGHSKLARQASDHLPLIVDVEIKGAVKHSTH